MLVSLSGMNHSFLYLNNIGEINNKTVTDVNHSDGDVLKESFSCPHSISFF